MKTASQLPNSLGLTLSDFCRFGDVKGHLSECSFADADKLLQAILALLNGIEKWHIRWFSRVDGVAEKLN
jgi:hypothetical protein